MFFLQFYSSWEVRAYQYNSKNGGMFVWTGNLLPPFFRVPHQTFFKRFHPHKKFVEVFVQHADSNQEKPGQIHPISLKVRPHHFNPRFQNIRTLFQGGDPKEAVEGGLLVLQKSLRTSPSIDIHRATTTPWVLCLNYLFIWSQIRSISYLIMLVKYSIFEWKILLTLYSIILSKVKDLCIRLWIIAFF